MIKERMNKKAQGLSVNAIILIVLGVIILVMLIVGFTIGWKKILPFIGGGDNVDTIVTQCGLACSTSSVYDYCGERSINFGDDARGEITVNCRGAEFHDIGLSSCGTVSSGCYPIGAPPFADLDSEANLGHVKSACQGAGKVWKTAAESKDVNCESYKYQDATYYCCDVPK